MGGLSTPIIVQNGQTTPLTNPTYVFANWGAGTTVAYGSYAWKSEQIAAGNSYLDFATVLSEVNVSHQNGRYTVALDGDYLVTYQLKTLESFTLSLLHLNSQGTVIDSLGYDGGTEDAGQGMSGIQAVVSLKAGESVALRTAPTGVEVPPPAPVYPTSFTIVRIGDNSNSSFPPASITVTIN